MNTFKDHRFCSHVFRWCKAHHLIQPTQKLLLAVSGGLDSMVLLDFFYRFSKKKFKASFSVGHFDHQLRPESGEQALWLKNYCESRDIPFFLGCQNIKETKLAQQSSIEAIARHVRYDWLLKTSQEEQCHAIITAHTASDQLETVLMRLIRGSVSGLGGINPKQSYKNRPLLRPFLGQSRVSLEGYAQAHGITWQEDPSNASDLYFRNRVRHHLVPLLKKENPNLENQMASHSVIWQAENQFLDHLAQAAFLDLQHCEHPLSLSIQPLKELDQVLQRRVVKQSLEAFLGTWKIYTSKHIEAILALLEAETGKYLILPCALKVTRKKHILIFESLSAQNTV